MNRRERGDERKGWKMVELGRFGRFEICYTESSIVSV